MRFDHWLEVGPSASLTTSHLEFALALAPAPTTAKQPLFLKNIGPSIIVD